MMEKKYDPKEVEKKIAKFWEENRIFAFDSSSSKPVFSIDTPPPTVSGTVHVGSVLGYASSEFIARFRRMRGFNVFYPMGFDDNGLASERFVEKKLGVKAVDMPRDEFVKLCLRRDTERREGVQKGLGRARDISRLVFDLQDHKRALPENIAEILHRNLQQRQGVQAGGAGHMVHELPDCDSASGTRGRREEDAVEYYLF